MKLSTATISRALRDSHNGSFKKLLVSGLAISIIGSRYSQIIFKEANLNEVYLELDHPKNSRSVGLLEPCAGNLKCITRLTKTGRLNSSKTFSEWIIRTCHIIMRLRVCYSRSANIQPTWWRCAGPAADVPPYRAGQTESETGRFLRGNCRQPCRKYVQLQQLISRMRCYRNIRHFTPDR